jgi:hypothetical protein
LFDYAQVAQPFHEDNRRNAEALAQAQGVCFDVLCATIQFGDYSTVPLKLPRTASSYKTGFIPSFL